MRNYFIFTVVFLTILSGCISAQHQLNKPDTIYIESTPSGAMVLLNSQIVGTTPLTVKLPRGEMSQYIKIVKEGYRPEDIILSATLQTVNIQKRTMLINSTVFFGGVGLLGGLAAGLPLQGLFGGSLLGLLVGLGQEEKELSTKYEYSPESINVNLLPLLNK